MRVTFTNLILFAGCGAPPGELPDASIDVDAAASAPTAAQLRARLSTCDPVLGGPFATDSGETANISICGLPGAVFWKADLDIDCDGKMTAQCNSSTDPYFMNETAAVDSKGQPLDSAGLPFVVVPGISARFDFRAAGLAMGSVFAVLYKDHVHYGVAGDVGPASIIGEASYLMAEVLEIAPDPATGGTDEEVSYIGFTGPTAIIDPIEDQNLATTVGRELATALVQN